MSRDPNTHLFYPYTLFSKEQVASWRKAVDCGTTFLGLEVYLREREFLEDKRAWRQAVANEETTDSFFEWNAHYHPDKTR